MRSHLFGTGPHGQIQVVLLHPGHDGVGVVDIDDGQAAKDVLALQRIAEDEGEHGGAGVTGVLVGAFKAKGNTGGIGGIGEVAKLLLGDVGGENAHIIGNVAAGGNLQGLVGADHGSGADAGDDPAIGIPLEDGLHGGLGLDGIQTGLAGDDLILAGAVGLQTGEDALLPLQQGDS